MIEGCGSDKRAGGVIKGCGGDKGHGGDKRAWG